MIDAMDLEIMAERLSGDYDRWALAAELGISQKSVWRMVYDGSLERPDHLEQTPDNHPRAIWTAEQVARMMLRENRQTEWYRKRDARGRFTP